ncbi:galactokinase [Thalassotalea nanhaiensis]|uniref:Galactokinase n=1 Tax=Thalassotalea nanhaiensis TaxID=3065648 RepID=A0ABY9TKD1_9GAMM|nr:galactokinase [Colwelliaceae bacterium SQ345]
MVDSLSTEFEKIYQHPATSLSSAPGRVNIIGEHTDYSEGLVLPCSLEFCTKVLYREREDNLVVVHSTNYPGESDRFDISEAIEHGNSQWGNYIRAMAFVIKRQGHSLCGVDVLISSDVPQGSGLSSSAALEVAIGGMFSESADLNLNSVTIALLGQEAENDFMDCQCGIMDQMISAKGEPGSALMIDCRDLSTQSIKIPDDLSLVIVNSNYPRKLVDSEYNQRRIDCEQAAKKMNVPMLRDATLELLASHRTALTAIEYKRAHHVITENQRVLDAMSALANSDMPTLKQLMSASHASLRDDFEVTVPATDGLVEICQTALGENGAVRMTGGGFGGAIVCLCREDDVALVKQAVDDQYFNKYQLHADVYVCSAGSGLKVEDIIAEPS